MVKKSLKSEKKDKTEDKDLEIENLKIRSEELSLTIKILRKEFLWNGKSSKISK